MRPTLTSRLAALGLALALPAIAGASDVEGQLAALAGQDEPARSLARQLLPREGSAIVPRLLALLKHDQPAVREAAYQVLADVANEASAPGRADERRAVTAHLMTLLAEGQPAEVKVRGLRLLPVVMPPDGDVGPVAVLLGDATLRERAREALEEVATAPSRRAIREFLGKSDPGFDVALLNSLGRLRDREGLPEIAAMLKSGPPRVRAAAARALAWTGDATYLKAVETLAASADPEVRPDASDALLRLLDAMARQHSGRKAAAEAYLALLRATRGPVQDGALAGLGRLGDPATIPAILSTIRGQGPPTFGVGIAALAAMAGAEATRALIEDYPSEQGPVRIALLGVLGSRQDPLALPILCRAARSTDGAERLAALEALAASGLGEALAFLAAEEKHADAALQPRIRAIRAQALEREKTKLLDRLQRGGKADAGLLGQLGVIGRWWVVGPFDLGEKDEGWETRYLGEPNVSVVARYMAGKVRRQWKRVDSHDSQGRIDLRAAIAEREHCVGYAYAEIELEEPVDAVLYLGVDDGEKVWVNGEKVFELFVRRGLQVDQDRVPVRLKAGTNTILVKVFQDTLGWEFCARIARADGRPVPFTQKVD